MHHDCTGITERIVGSAHTALPELRSQYELLCTRRRHRARPSPLVKRPLECAPRFGRETDDVRLTDRPLFVDDAGLQALHFPCREHVFSFSQAPCAKGNGRRHP